MIYLDYNATTPIDPRVAEAMTPYIRSEYGNPSSSHAPGARAKVAVEEARGAVRFSLGRFTTRDEIDAVLIILNKMA
jgi:cysteine desulfurase